MAGIEPTNAGTKNRCLTAWRHPSVIITLNFHFERTYLFRSCSSSNILVIQPKYICGQLKKGNTNLRKRNNSCKKKNIFLQFKEKFLSICQYKILFLYKILYKTHKLIVNQSIKQTIGIY